MRMDFIMDHHDDGEDDEIIFPGQELVEFVLEAFQFPDELRGEIEIYVENKSQVPFELYLACFDMYMYDENAIDVSTLDDENYFELFAINEDSFLATAVRNYYGKQ